MADNMVQWEPRREMMSLREAMDRLFEDSFVGSRVLAPWAGGNGSNSLAMDVLENEDHFVVTAPVPGMKPEDVEITVTGNTLTIKGETEQEAKHEKGNYIQQERRYGKFQRSVTLPVDVEPEQCEANFENGILKLTLPKVEKAKPRSIKINVK